MVYWLIVKLLPIRLITGLALLVIGTQMMGLDLVTPLLDLGSDLLGQLLGSLWDTPSLW
jgi:hypothetical protein